MKECEHCGVQIVERRKQALFCSDECGNKARNKRHYEKHYEKYAEKRKKYDSDWPKAVLARVKSRSKRNNIPFDLEVSDIEVPTHCPVFGTLLERGVGSGFHPCSPSLDRIIPSLGYVKGNVRVISARANLLKNDATIDELSKVLADLIDLKEKYGAHI